ncbi:sigma-70 family RNA polymerase sigma factor [Gracilibacillus sp. S3-1-1]|uniref:Sigma-70 family RNA polymerase sigma factor n=1 Tax=Gracilibacillus pellucidus TaxID=3095368 RepID=A0ACC6M0C5_9BACI|nr:sigma-70 family RNA polymerase sigma factor [Gracilibacillus sp. S3-1-1]MDX8044392.1 sigma-70 family RNA polymerase sigma factor [Gracilibacillus sp. S3-1-1]
MYTKKDVQKATKGNKKAIETILQAERANMYKIAYLYVKNQADALEIIQEAVYKAFVSIHTIRDHSHVSAWLKQIVIHAAIDYIRKYRKVIPLIDGQLENIADSSIDIDQQLDLYRLLDELDEKQKSIIILKYYEGYRDREIAEIIGCAEGTVKSTLHRTLLRLRKKIKKEDCANE